MRVTCDLRTWAREREREKGQASICEGEEERASVVIGGGVRPAARSSRSA
jgi:hypothetical protein